LNLADYARIGVDLAFLMRSQWWPEERIRAHQDHRLIEIMRHAVSEVPYYKGLGIAPESINSSRDLSRFPVLTKKEIQDHADDLLWPKLTKAELFSSRTSGTTCEPTTTYFDRRSWLFSKFALKIRRVSSVVSPLRKRLLMIHPERNDLIHQEDRRRPKGFRLFTVQRHLSLFDPIETHIPVVLDFKPDIANGYPSYFMELVDALRSRNVTPPVIPVIFTSSEFLSPQWRRSIEETLKGRIFDVYGTTEFKEVAWQCREGEYHVNFENVYLESRSDGGHGGDGEAPRPLLITCLSNRAMPLIRFDVGDLARTEWGPCPCGRFSPRIFEIHGRETDLVSLSSGKRVSPYLLTTVIEGHPGIRKYQIVQEGPWDIRIDYVAFHGTVPPQELRTLTGDLVRAVGEELTFTFNPVGELHRSASGKFKILQREPDQKQGTR
jgi:phenylacetate-CoA ligase